MYRRRHSGHSSQCFSNRGIMTPHPCLFNGMSVPLKGRESRKSSRVILKIVLLQGNRGDFLCLLRGPATMYRSLGV